MAMKCPNCGAENAEGKKFCGDCGAPIQVQRTSEPTRPRARGHRVLWALVIVGVIVVIIVAVVTLEPFAPTHHATIDVTLWTNVDSPYFFYLNNHLIKKGEITTVQNIKIDANVSWKGALLHDCLVQVMGMGTAGLHAVYSKTVTVTDGMTWQQDICVVYG